MKQALALLLIVLSLIVIGWKFYYRNDCPPQPGLSHAKLFPRAGIKEPPVRDWLGRCLYTAKALP